MSNNTASQPGTGKGSTGRSRSVEEIEADIAAARERLAGTVDELHTRTAPHEIARRQVASAKAKFTEATHTESGDLRTERIAALAAAAVALIGLGAIRRRRG
jgi:MYXO-CTERM domain-containing protein